MHPGYLLSRQAWFLLSYNPPKTLLLRKPQRSSAHEATRSLKCGINIEQLLKKLIEIIKGSKDPNLHINRRFNSIRKTTDFKLKTHIQYHIIVGCKESQTCKKQKQSMKDQSVNEFNNFNPKYILFVY